MAVTVEVQSATHHLLEVLEREHGKGTVLEPDRNRRAVRRNGSGADVLVELRGAHKAALGGIPQPHGLVVAASDKDAQLGVHRQRPELALAVRLQT